MARYEDRDDSSVVLGVAAGLIDASSELATRAKELADRTRDSLSSSVEVGKDAYQKTKEELAARLDA